MKGIETMNTFIINCERYRDYEQIHNQLWATKQIYVYFLKALVNQNVSNFFSWVMLASPRHNINTNGTPQYVVHN